MDAAAQDELIQRAQQRGYLEIRDSRRVVYRCRRQHEANWADPEEKVRAAVFAWLILEREYPANGIDVEVTISRRTPSAHADIVVYDDDACRVPYLVVETRARGLHERDARQAVEQAFDNANSLRARYALYDNADESRLFDIANYPSTERVANCLGPRDALGIDYDRARAFRLIAGSRPGVEDIGPVSSRDLQTLVRRAHGLIWAGGARDPLSAFEEWCKLLFAKLHDERWAPTGQPRRFQVGAGENDVSVGNRVRGLYADAQRQDPTIWVSPIHLPDAKIRQVVQTIQQVALRSMDMDTLGTVFDRFFSTSLRGGLGQYLATVPAGMTRYRLGDVVLRREEEVVPAQSPDEALVTLTLTQAGGLEPRVAGKGDPIDWHGAYVKPGARWFRARTDNLVISRIDVWQGRAAIIPPEFDGAIVTREFPLFQIREDKLRRYYLKLLLRAGYFQRAIRAITMGYSTRRRTRDDDFESRIDVWKGCVAFIPPEFDGAIVTREFPLFQVREDKLRTSYLKLLLRTEYFQGAICGLTMGHAQRRRTQDNDFEDLEIFLPSVDVQDRIVQVGQDRERAVRADTRDVDRLVGEIERCVRGELSADELLAAAGGSASEDAAAS